MAIYTLNRCTIEVAKGRQSAKVTRHGTGEAAQFGVLAVDGAPTPEVQAQRWALGMPPWVAPAAPAKAAAREPEKPRGKR